MKRKNKSRHPAPAASPKANPPSHASHSIPPSQAAPVTTAAPPPPLNPVPSELKGLLARVTLTPEMTAAESMSRIMDPCLKEAGIDLMTVADFLQEQGQAAADGDLSVVRRTLTAQVAMLDRIFHHLFTLATVGSNTPETCSCFMRLALRAQTQSARTSAILARICGEAARATAGKQPQGQGTPAGEGSGTMKSRASRLSAATSGGEGPRQRFVAPVPMGLPSVSPRRAMRSAGGQTTGGGALLSGLNAPRV